MRNFLVATSILTTSLTSYAQAAPFLSDSLILYRIDASGISLSAPVFIDEYSRSGTLRQTVAVPTSASGSNAALYGIGNASDEGQISLSGNGSYVTLAGYAAPSSGLSSNTTINAAFSGYNRVVGRIELSSGIVDTSTNLGTSTQLGATNATTNVNVRDAVTNDGSQFWVAANGIRYATLGSSASSTSITAFSTRAIEINGGNLYTTSSGGTTNGAPGRRLNRVSGGLITSGTASLNFLNSLQFPIGTAPGNVTLFDLNPSVPGVDTAYIADSFQGASNADTSRSILRYDFDGTDWLATYNLKTFVGTPSTTNATGGVVGVAGYLNSLGNPVLFATTLDGRVVRFNDTATASVASAGTTIITASAGQVFRGIVVVPEPTSLALIGIAGLVALRRRRA